MQRTLLILLLSLPCSTALRAQEPRSPLLDSFAQYAQLRQSSEFGLEWVSLGPVLNSARVEAVQCDPSSPGTMYVAFGSGNLWKSTNAGLAWKPIFEGQSALGIGDIALAPSNPDVLWLGSGESLKKARNFTMPGTGVFLSRDGGETWRNVGLHDSWHIGEIAVHPTDPDTALVAVLGHFWSTNPNRGLYRTTDGGETWEHVLFIDERTGANDVVIAPSNPDVVYASTWENNPGVSGAASGVHKSADGGRTWTRLQGGLPEGPDTGRIGLAVSWTNPNKVYALVDNLAREDHPAEVYRSQDGGRSWERTHADDLQIFSGSRIGWYFADCHVNPRNDDEVYALGIRMARSSDGGRTFQLVGGDVTHLVPSPAQGLHLDQCEMWIDPQHPEHLVLGNDGGLFVSHDRGASWLHHNNIAAGEFYDIAVDNQDPYLIYGGTQDDASVRGPARERRAWQNDAWEYVWLDPWSGGDGCTTLPDPEDPNTVYFSSQHNGIRRQDVSTKRSKRIAPRLPSEHEGQLQHSFVAPYLISTHDHRTLYHAGNYVFRSPDRGDSWDLISPDLSLVAAPERESTAACALAESPLEAGLLYCGMDGGALWVTRDDGHTWTEHSDGLPPHTIRSIWPSRFAKSRVYVAVTGINHDDLRAYLYASDDFGETWRSITGGLPDEVAYAITEDPRFEDVLYAGMYRGVYVSTDRGRSWSLLGRGMPAVAVADLVVQERELDLIAATHGRGIYRLSLAPLHWFLEQGDTEANALAPIPAATLPRPDDTLPKPSRSYEERVPITFSLTRAGPLTLSVRDGEGTTVWTRELEGRKGLNQFLWDLVSERRESPGPYFTDHVIFLGPGAYELRIAGDGVLLSGKLEVIRH